MTSTSKKACSTGIGSQIMEIVFMYIYIYLIEKETFPDKQGFYTWSVLSRKNLPNCCLMKPCLFASQFSKSKDQAHPKSYPSQESLFFKGLLLMAEILHRSIGSISHYLQSYIHPKWCRNSAINSITHHCPWIRRTLLFRPHNEPKQTSRSFVPVVWGWTHN